MCLKHMCAVKMKALCEITIEHYFVYKELLKVLFVTHVLTWYTFKLILWVFYKYRYLKVDFWNFFEVA